MTGVHNTIWYEDKRAATIPINGLAPDRDFAIWTPVGEVIIHGYDQVRKYSWLDYFLLIIPPAKLRLIVTLTNRVKTTTIGEVLKLFEIWILTTQFDFWPKTSIWSTTALSKYAPELAFGNTGMPLYRFDTLGSVFVSQTSQICAWEVCQLRCIGGGSLIIS